MIFSGIQRTSTNDFPGRLCTVLFLGGCPFRCHYCHNKELVLPELIDKNEQIADDEVMSKLDARKYLVDAVSITGGEVTIHDDLPDFIDKLKTSGYKVKIDTNGVNPHMLKKVLPMLDYVAMDVKAPLEHTSYKKITGTDVNIEKIQDSINYIMDSGTDYEFRTTVVPDLFTEDMFHELGRQLTGARRLVLQGFRNGKTLNPDFSDARMYSEKELEKIRSVMLKYLDDVQVR
ncbi:MAG: anaerobic ribonucleoside-triphosphate reductase activating protein [Candidatus Woesearchaeota archaeon]